MLLDLSLKDYAIVDSLELSFGPGFCVITGETGAGKSIIVEALSLLFGGKSGPETVREGAAEAVVEAVFALPGWVVVTEELREAEVAPGGEVIVRRTIAADGRSAFRVNGRRFSRKGVEVLGEHLADIHGQHQHYGLLDPSNHILYLDRFAGLEAKVAELGAAWRGLRETRREAGEVRRQLASGDERAETARFQLGEIDGARLVPGEEELLRERRGRLANAALLQELTAEAASLLTDGETSAVSLAAAARRALARAAERDPSLAPRVTAADELLTIINELTREVSAYRESIDSDPAALETLEERLALISRLKARYGGSVEGILDHAERLRASSSSAEELRDRLAGLDREAERSAYLLSSLAPALTAGRRDAAGRFSSLVEERVRGLGIPNGRFRAEVVPLPENDGEQVGGFTVGPRGADTVRFLFAPNPGEGERALDAIASGGELSRVMLAIKAVLAGHDRVETLVFDEIDVGIGGKVASAVGGAMRVLAAGRQVFCVTHLPQIAALADRHLRVDKVQAGGRTTVAVTELAREGREQELARMLAGPKVTPTVLRHAAELLEQGHDEDHR
jgi:DNA repair protein RecN (Recombination protein N)